MLVRRGISGIYYLPALIKSLFGAQEVPTFKPLEDAGMTATSESAYQAVVPTLDDCTGTRLLEGRRQCLYVLWNVPVSRSDEQLILSTSRFTVRLCATDHMDALSYKHDSSAVVRPCSRVSVASYSPRVNHSPPRSKDQVSALAQIFTVITKFYVLRCRPLNDLTPSQ